MSFLNLTPEQRAALTIPELGLDGNITPETFPKYWALLPKPVQQKLARSRTNQAAIARLLTPDPEQLEAEGPLSWVKRFYPQTFTRDFTSYQKDFWAWGWQIQPDTYYRPRVECAPRGAGKSTTAETWLVSLLARKRRKTIGYISSTDTLATRHFNGVKRKLENADLLKVYPHLKPQVQKYRSAFSSWSQDRLVTDAGQVIIPITLQGSNRGFKSDDDMRFDCFIFDDIDQLGESPDVIAKNIDLLKSEILLAGYANTLNTVFQNLIHRDSVVTQIMDDRADMLSDNDFHGPYSLMKWYDAEKREMPDGGKRWVITAGEPYDPALPKEYCESVLNQIGRDLFDRECQQDVWKVAEDKDFREWDEVYHIITQSEMERGFQKVQLSDANGFFIPSRWHVGRGLDFGTTRGHPSACIYVTRPDQTCPYDESHFVFAEVVLPKFPFDPSLASEVVSPGRVAHAMKTTERRFRIRDAQIEQSKMSHEASAAKNTLMLDLPQELTTFFNKWKAAKGSGVPQIQNMLEIDRTKAHPFRVYPQGHPHAGMPIMGRPRVFFVVADKQGELFCDGDGKLRVRGATDAEGLARLRYEIPLYNHRNAGAKKLDDDAVDGLRGLMATFGVQADALTEREQIAAAVPEKYQLENVFGDGYTPEKEMGYIYQQSLARQRVQSTQAVTFDEFGNALGQESEDLVGSIW